MRVDKGVRAEPNLVPFESRLNCNYIGAYLLTDESSKLVEAQCFQSTAQSIARP